MQLRVQGSARATQATRLTVRASATPSPSPVPAPSRRALLSQVALGAVALTLIPASSSSAADSALKGLIRKEADFPDDKAFYQLKLAQRRLDELIAVASTPRGSEDRKVNEKMWPAFAKALREAGDAALVLTERYSISELSEFYGGNKKSDDIARPISVTEAMLVSIGTVITISGRTVREEARYDPDRAKDVQQKIAAFEREALKKAGRQ